MSKKYFKTIFAIFPQFLATPNFSNSLNPNEIELRVERLTSSSYQHAPAFYLGLLIFLRLIRMTTIPTARMRAIAGDIATYGTKALLAVPEPKT